MKLEGLIAATFAPMNEDKSLNLDLVPDMLDYIIDAGVTGLYVNGSTGEGPSLTNRERMDVAEAYTKAAAGRIPVVVQVGHNSLTEARTLAAHAASIGADAISAVTPNYFKPASLDLLIESMAEVASAAPDLPFYYYNIPVVTGVSFNMVNFLEQGASRIPSLGGIKYSNREVEELQACLNACDGRYTILFGVDEMLMHGIAAGAPGAVGTTYNYGAPLYTKIIDAVENGDIPTARALQAISVEMVMIARRYGGSNALKAMMQFTGFDCGPCRLPLSTLTQDAANAMRDELDALGFLDYIK
jgi:N-acetylneuraminate lyase